MGYFRAGFGEIVGVDIKPQKNYPFKFVQGDALEYLAAHGKEFDFIHASPPCQKFSTMRRGLWKDRKHPDLIGPTRDLLIKIGCPFIIENVEGARSFLREPILLCGIMFGLGTKEGNQLRRHRYFEISTGPVMTPPCNHNKSSAVPVYGGGQNDDYHSPKRKPKTIGVWGNAGGSSSRDGLVQFGTEARREAMGIDWMSGKELSQSIPPAYTFFLGKIVLDYLKKSKSAEAVQGATDRKPEEA